MSERSTRTTRSKLRQLATKMNSQNIERLNVEADSGMQSDAAPVSPSVAPTTVSFLAPVIPLAGGRIIDHTVVTPVVSGGLRARRAVGGSRASLVSSRSGQKSADFLRRRVEYEAEIELVRLKENLVKKKLEADLAEIDAAEEESSGDEGDTTRRVTEWIEASPQQQDMPVSVPGPAPSEQFAHPAPCASPVTVPAAPREAAAPTVPCVAPEATAPRVAYVPVATPVTSTFVKSAPNIYCAPAPGRVSESAATMRPTYMTPVATTNAPRVVSREENNWDGVFIEDRRRDTSHERRDRKIDQLAEAITGLARPRPVPRQAYELPMFSGDPAEWISYKNMYNDTAALYNFKPHENLARLKTSLQGEAKRAVEDLLRTSTDPADIMVALDEEFGHPNLILECALRKVRALPRVTESGRELRKFATTVRNCVSLLKNIQADGYLNNPQLVSELISKLTPVQRAQYGDFAMGLATSQGIDLRVSPSLEVMSDFLVHLARATSYYVQMEVGSSSAPAAAPAKRGGPPVKNALVNRQVHKLHVHSEGSEYDPERDSRKKDIVYECTMCKGAHTLVKCDKFSNLKAEEKWQHVKTNRLCFKCLVRRHSKNFCRADKCSKCDYAHHVLLHTDKKTESVANVSDYSAKALLKILPVCVTVGSVDHDCYALLDDGATVSLIDASLAGGAEGQCAPLVLRSARGHETKDASSRVLHVSVRGPNGQSHEIKCRTLKQMDLPTQTVPAALLAENAHLRHLDCEEMRGARPLLLLGQDNWELLVSRETRRGRSGMPVASLTSLGWVVHGPVGRGYNDGDEAVNCMREPLVDLQLTNMVKAQFELEAIGITEVPRSHRDNDRAEAILEATSRHTEDGAWEVGLLWRRDDPQLPDNYKYARQRMAGVVRRLNRDPEYAEAYVRQVERFIEHGYARKLEKGVTADPVWYLPHFGVTNPNKPGKLRLVFDAAATYNGTCLNDNLLTGPDLLNSLLGILFKFRIGPIAFTGDIADMFLRIKIREQDRGAQLFLWSAAPGEEPDVYEMCSMVFGAVSSPTTAIYILNKNAAKYAGSCPEAVSAIQSRHYMDDYLDSTWSVAQAGQLIEQVTHIHAQGGFVIRDWVTNSPELRDRLQIDQPDRVSLDKGEGTTERTLGMIWAPDTDQLAFDLSFKRLPTDIVEGRTVPTKREFLRFIMSIFDPLGFLYPCVIKSRILMQRVWRTGIQWDERLRDAEARVWFEWLHSLKQLDDVHIPRWYGLKPEGIELHVFGDASASAYAAVAYLVGYNACNDRDVAIVVGKARVAPQKVISIPRLELQAAVLASRLASTVEKELGIAIVKKYLWTDSKTVLKWINSDAQEFQRFVSHRLAEIDRRSKRSDWRWVPSTMNPADKATRMDWPNTSNEWLSGPPFLRCPQEQWPVDTDLDAVAEADLERVQRVHTMTTPGKPLLNYERLATWTHALYVMARVVIFVERCRGRRQSSAVTAEDLHGAELRLLRIAQAESYGEDIAALRHGRALPRDSKLRPLDPMLFEEGLVRVRGRLGACGELSFGERHPIILDGRHALTRKLLLHYHAAALHANQETVVNSIREKYWVSSLRSAVKAVTASCQRCRLTRAKPVAPKMGDLPAARLGVTRRAFVHCGVDYFGPMEVAIGRRREKRWGVLFTCLTTRAVHLELAASLSADSAILALRRLIARRGRPACLYSDRGTNFVGAHSELRAALREMDHGRLQSDATSRGIVWRFNPPASPHMGGCWERLVRSVKNALKATLRERAPREEVLYTLLAEAELVVNSRPLTYISSDIEQPVVLTPNHLLLGTAAGDAPSTRQDDGDLDSRRMWRRANALADLFWRRWLREYLPTLQRRGKWVDGSPNVKVGDVVLVVDSNKPRNQWTKGVVCKIYLGSDSIVRVIDIRTANGVLRRPVVGIVVLPTDGTVIG